MNVLYEDFITSERYIDSKLIPSVSEAMRGISIQKYLTGLSISRDYNKVISDEADFYLLLLQHSDSKIEVCYEGLNRYKITIYEDI